jgi:hypothetical protein
MSTDPLRTNLYQPQVSDDLVRRPRLPDQSVPLGVLNTRYDLHLPLISVECQSLRVKNA